MTARLRINYTTESTPHGQQLSVIDETPTPSSLSHHLTTVYSQSMSSSRPLPQELVDKIIDDLGKDYQNPAHKKCPDDRISVTRKALHACTLVSKNWTGRSRAHLFKEVKIRPGGIGLFLTPPETVVPYTTGLKIQLRSEMFQLSPSADLLSLFYPAPIVRFEITGGVLSPGRDYLVDFIAALSSTLQTVTLKSCALSTHLFHDIVLAHPGLKHLYLRYCQIWSPYPVNPRTSRLGVLHSANLELGIFATADLEDWSPLTMIALLPIEFCKFNFDYAPGSSMTYSANTLIKANVWSLSSLTVHILVCMSGMLGQKKNTHYRAIQQRWLRKTSHCSAWQVVPTYRS